MLAHLVLGVDGQVNVQVVVAEEEGRGLRRLALETDEGGRVLERRGEGQVVGDRVAGAGGVAALGEGDELVQQLGDVGDHLLGAGLVERALCYRVENVGGVQRVVDRHPARVGGVESEAGVAARAGEGRG